MNHIHVFTRSVMVLISLLLLGACASTPPPPTAQATSTAISTPTPTPYVEPPTPIPLPLGPVPQNCPPGPTPQQVFSDVGPAVGTAPIWAIGFDGPHATIQFSPLITYTQYGWPRKILWRVSTRYTQPITLHGGNLRMGTPLWFQIEVQDPSTAPVLDPQPKEQQIAQSGYPYPPEGVDWGSYVYIPMAGCYYIEATWPGGHWRVTFAAGRQ